MCEGTCRVLTGEDRNEEIGSSRARRIMAHFSAFKNIAREDDLMSERKLVREAC